MSVLSIYENFVEALRVQRSQQFSGLIFHCDVSVVDFKTWLFNFDFSQLSRYELFFKKYLK